MDNLSIRSMLEQVASGGMSVNEASSKLSLCSEAVFPFAVVDTGREARTGFPEVIYGAGKTPAQVVTIAKTILKASGRVFMTRLDALHLRALRRAFKKIQISGPGRCAFISSKSHMLRPGFIAVVAAGTSDIPVAEEAAETANAMGSRVERIYDVGVAGLHRLLSRVDALRQADALVVVAGMEGALPSVVAGLVACPVVAVPTSVGYGASFGGLAALLGMLNSCGSGVTVVNIDNGFGGGFAAARIQALKYSSHP